MKTFTKNNTLILKFLLKDLLSFLWFDFLIGHGQESSIRKLCCHANHFHTNDSQCQKHKKNTHMNIVLYIQTKPNQTKHNSAEI